MEISVQPKILKAIEEKQVVRLGGYEPIKTDIKIVSAVNENPLQCIAENKLREDLFLPPQRGTVKYTATERAN